MILTDTQTDALTELINIAFSRTAASLSEMTGHRVEIDVPEVDICSTADLSERLGKSISGDLATVHQVFTGPVGGSAMLILNTDGAAMLVDLLTDGQTLGRTLDTSAREVLTEVGNILLNACLGMFGNLLKVHVSFSVPDLHLQQLESMLSTLVVSDQGLQYALVVSTTFRLKESAVQGCLVIVLGVASLDRLLDAVSAWSKSEGEI